jgi:lipopolysaccharide transport system ATP-binding protein
MENAILIQGLSKRYIRTHADRPWTFQELFSRGFAKPRRQDEFWALRDINFELAPGKMAGIIGRNGSGKSTLLRLTGGVGKADQGTIITQGRVGALIDLGAGFHPDLTGRENVFINGVISGLTRREVRQKFDSIVAFAELDDFIDSPLRIYSMGMQMRLAFAVAIHIQPNILLIDEVLAVGDLAFQNKCLDRIAQFKAQGCTILLVSHDAGLVGKLCDEVLWLDKGKVVARGDAQEVVERYVDEMEAQTETIRRTPAVDLVQPTPAGIDLKLNENRFGSLEIRIESVRMYNSRGDATHYLESGQGLTVVIDYDAPEPIPAPIFGVIITRKDELVCWDGNSSDQLLPNAHLHGKGRVILSLDRLDLARGEYFVDVGIYEQDWTYAYDYHWQVYPLEIGAPTHQKGILLPPHSWTFEER